jgi:hypothetical protein
MMEPIQILNNGFEGGWREVDGIGELKVAGNWYPWWHASDTRPEYKIATVEVDPYRIHSGVQAQQWFNTYDTHTAGIYQQILDLEVGRAVLLTAFVQAFTRNDDTNWRESTGRYRMRIGIDPYGGTNPESGDVLWSGTVQPYDAYVPLAVEDVTRSDRCTIFVWGQAEWAFKHNNAYVDQVELWYTDDKVPPVEPPPGEGVTEERVIELIEQYHGWK